MLGVAWLGVFGFSAVPVFMFYNIWSTCEVIKSPQTNGTASVEQICVDIRQYGTSFQSPVNVYALMHKSAPFNYYMGIFLIIMISFISFLWNGVYTLSLIMPHFLNGKIISVLVDKGCHLKFCYVFKKVANIF